jgi:hypothetical protein
MKPTMELIVKLKFRRHNVVCEVLVLLTDFLVNDKIEQIKICQEVYEVQMGKCYTNEILLIRHDKRIVVNIINELKGLVNDRW